MRQKWTRFCFFTDARFTLARSDLQEGEFAKCGARNGTRQSSNHRRPTHADDGTVNMNESIQSEIVDGDILAIILRGNLDSTTAPSV